MRACAVCGEPNADDGRFCHACGAPLASGDRETRKTVTVLFADVTGSTALGERLDPESLRQVMARYFDEARTCLERHGGTVEKFIGDAVMGVFGVPSAHEDDALRAARAAVDIRAAVAELNDALARDFGVVLQVRTGLNSGEVVTGTAERAVTGDAVNVAARLEQAAAPGEILIGDETLRLTRDAVETEPVAPVALKGKAQPVAAHRLVGVLPDAPAFARRLDAPLIGRGEALATLRAAFDETVRDRACRMVTVLGPPGIGKSRLARELDRLVGNEARVLSGRCLSYGDGITYWPLNEIFNAAGASGELADALSATGTEEVFWAVRKALERHARERPLALVVEDIHWAEPTLLDLLEHLAEWTRDAPMLLVCPARPEFRETRPRWAGTLLVLEPLSDAQQDELIEALAGPSAPVDGIRQRIRDVAEGNPLFVEQLLAMVAEGGGPDDVPPTIRALLAGRLDALPEREVEVLELASVAGLEFGWEDLARLAADGRRPAGAALAALARKELTAAHDTDADVFRFRHALIRDAAYERIPKARRADLHERFAHGLGDGEELREIAAYHLEQAHGLLVSLAPPDDRARGLAARAATVLAESGRRAAARGDAPAAADLLGRAAALLRADDPARLPLLVPLGSALWDAARVAEADAVLSEAVAAAVALGERTEEVDAALTLSVLRLVTSAAEGGAGQQAVWRELERAIPVYRDTADGARLGRALVISARLDFWAGHAARAIDELVRAAEHARAAGDASGEATGLRVLFAALQVGPTPVAEAVARIDSLSGVFARNRQLEAWALGPRGVLAAMAGEIDAARSSVARARRLAEDLGSGMVQAVIARQAGTIELLAGDPVAAERELQVAYAIHERHRQSGFLTGVVPLLIDAVVAQGRVEEGVRLAEMTKRITVAEDVEGQIGWRRALGVALARRGDVDAAVGFAQEAVAVAARTDYLDLHAQALADLADALRAGGRAGAADAATREAVELHERKGNVVAARRLRRPRPVGGGQPPARSPSQ